jgi:hypothetical protein
VIDGYVPRSATLRSFACGGAHEGGGPQQNFPKCCAVLDGLLAGSTQVASTTALWCCTEYDVCSSIGNAIGMAENFK